MTRYPITGSSWSNANRLAGGNLVRLLKRMRADELSARNIATELEALPELTAQVVADGVPPPYRIDTSYTTVNSWLRKLGVH
jgi:hypothetical protein